MNDDGKTKAQLIKEPGEMHRQVAGSETAQQQSNHPIPKMNARMNAMIKAFDGLIYICSQDYRIEFMNEHLISRTGYDGAGELCYKVLHERDSTCPWCVNDRVLKGETVRWEVKSPKDNRWYYIVNTPIDNKDGTISKQAMILDITAHKRAEALLKESKEKYNQFFKTSRDCTFITSKDGSWIDLNDAAVELFGYSSLEELIQVKVRDVYANPKERAKHNRIIAACGYAGEFPVDLRRKDGSVKHTLCTTVSRYDADGKVIGFQGTIRDVTEQIQVEEELRKCRQDLEALVAERTSELESRTKNLRDVNTALNVLLQKREEDKNILEESFVANIRSIILPYVEKIRKNNLDAQQQFCLDVIEKNLGEIASPLLNNIRQFDLTPREVQVASLIKEGKTTKEVAQALGIEKGSIDTHRKNIRKKIGLDRASNLQSHLRFLEK